MAHIPPELNGIIVSNPEILGGRLCFKGTRVPVETFFDYINTGYSLDRFLSGFTSVHREQAMAILDWQNQRSKQAILQETVS